MELWHSRHPAAGLSGPQRLNLSDPPMREFLRIQAFVFACCLGGYGGAGLSAGTFGRRALEQYRAAHPNEACGLFMIPYVAVGFVAGAVIAAVVVWWVHRYFAAGGTRVPPG